MGMAVLRPGPHSFPSQPLGPCTLRLCCSMSRRILSKRKGSSGSSRVEINCAQGLQRLMGILIHSRFLGGVWCIANGYIFLIVLIWTDGVHLVHLQQLEWSIELGGIVIHKAETFKHFSFFLVVLGCLALVQPPQEVSV